MQYNLTQTQVLQISTWVDDFDKYYSDIDALILRSIAKKAVSNMFLDEADVYALMEVLPRIIPSPPKKFQEKSENQSVNWNEYIDGQRIRYRREMECLHQMLSNWIFMQSAAYRKKIDPLEKPIGKARFNNIGQGIK